MDRMERLIYMLDIVKKKLQLRQLPSVYHRFKKKFGSSTAERVSTLEKVQLLDKKLKKWFYLTYILYTYIYTRGLRTHFFHPPHFSSDLERP